MTQDVRQAVEVEAPPERVWQLLTDPAELPRWWPDAAELGLAVESRQMHEQGWSFFLDNLERYLTAGEDQRAAAMQQRTTGAGARAGGP